MSVWACALQKIFCRYARRVEHTATISQTVSIINATCVLFNASRAARFTGTAVPSLVLCNTPLCKRITSTCSLASRRIESLKLVLRKRAEMKSRHLYLFTLLNQCIFVFFYFGVYKCLKLLSLRLHSAKQRLLVHKTL